MNRNAILFIDRDIDFIFIRMDRDRDGRITYSEVIIYIIFNNLNNHLFNLLVL